MIGRGEANEIGIGWRYTEVYDAYLDGCERT
jgi:hypothetical protein